MQIYKGPWRKDMKADAIMIKSAFLKEKSYSNLKMRLFLSYD